MHSAQHRALRELYAVARSLCGRWGSLSRRVDASVPVAGVSDARRLADEVRAVAGVAYGMRFLGEFVDTRLRR